MVIHGQLLINMLYYVFCLSCHFMHISTILNLHHFDSIYTYLLHNYSFSLPCIGYNIRVKKTHPNEKKYIINLVSDFFSFLKNPSSVRENKYFIIYGLFNHFNLFINLGLLKKTHLNKKKIIFLIIFPIFQTCLIHS